MDGSCIQKRCTLPTQICIFTNILVPFEILGKANSEDIVTLIGVLKLNSNVQESIRLCLVVYV